MKAALVLPFALLLAACQEEPQAALTPEALARDWRLVALNGAAAPARATLDLREPGKAAGQAPCNRWFATRSGDLPAFTLSQIGATRMACPDLAAESAYLAALAAVTGAALDGEALVLTGPEGGTLRFVPGAP
ncbi:Heat shock protein HslJ [Gemmobacter aquatilis]|uniref:Heat shock protein HslJ n=1 Tax=Gemmobacter aquatilis TaxID=933059 RepID=A0A1H8CSQ1_9RHOB|nr:META domain-containing protein [Gemmobacter aquatilis]SEM98010.1 Heat shock protein HslJ [Gemmobacter aquatilis]